MEKKQLDRIYEMYFLGMMKYLIKHGWNIEHLMKARFNTQKYENGKIFLELFNKLNTKNKIENQEIIWWYNEYNAYSLKNLAILFQKSTITLRDLVKSHLIQGLKDPVLSDFEIDILKKFIYTFKNSILKLGFI